MALQGALRLDLIWTSSAGGSGGGAMGMGFKVCRARQLSSMATCCTQETVQRGAQNLVVKNSRRRISGVYCSSRIPG